MDWQNSKKTRLNKTHQKQHWENREALVKPNIRVISEAPCNTKIKKNRLSISSC